MIKGESKRYLVFGLFRIDVTERLLFNAEGAVPLTPKAFDTLLMLVENSGHVLGKDELMKAVWPDSFVEENNLAQNISTLRKVLSEGGEKFIETVPKRGYRFIAEVKERYEGMKWRAETGLDKMQASLNDLHHKKGESLLRDVVIIGRAIDFK
jgi:DNA-binding winged helix-turn-helix (wHTH) protein